MDLFARYSVHVGISIDGPGELNDARWAGSLEKTRATTARTQAAIKQLCENGRPPSLIITLHRGNGLPECWQQMDEWLLEMQALGIISVRLHVLEADYAAVNARWAMNDAQNAAAFLHFYDFERRHLKTLQFDVFKEIRHLLLGDDEGTSCVWHACDPYTTEAVRGIEGFGERTNCGRTNKRGIDFIKTDVPGFERSWILYHTPQSAGGCRDCRFFAMCKGQCPGTAIDGDWRNRSIHCPLWTSLFERIEFDLLSEGAKPLSCDPRRQELEQSLLRTWMVGHTVSLSRLIKDLELPAVPATN